MKFKVKTIAKLITLDYDNLLTFCKYQIEDTMSRLKTTEKKELKKYIPEVFVIRQKILKIFHKFLNSDKSCLIIYGDGGIGKTNSICNLVENSKNNYPCIFYNASELNTNLDKSLVTDFSWEFSSSKPPEQYIKQLHDILETYNKDLLIFIDGIDEWSLENVEVALSDFVKRIKEKRISLIITCKNTKIQQFLWNKGVQTSFDQNTYVEDTANNKQAVFLDKFNDFSIKRCIKEI